CCRSVEPPDGYTDAGRSATVARNGTGAIAARRRGSMRGEAPPRCLLCVGRRRVLLPCTARSGLRAARIRRGPLWSRVVVRCSVPRPPGQWVGGIGLLSTISHGEGERGGNGGAAHRWGNALELARSRRRSHARRERHATASPGESTGGLRGIEPSLSPILAG